MTDRPDVSDLTGGAGASDVLLCCGVLPGGLVAVAGRADVIGRAGDRAICPLAPFDPVSRIGPASRGGLSSRHGVSRRHRVSRRHGVVGRHGVGGGHGVGRRHGLRS
jgi:hypothetical protein